MNISKAILRFFKYWYYSTLVKTKGLHHWHAVHIFLCGSRSVCIARFVAIPQLELDDFGGWSVWFFRSWFNAEVSIIFCFVAQFCSIHLQRSNLLTLIYSHLILLVAIWCHHNNIFANIKQWCRLSLSFSWFLYFNDDKVGHIECLRSGF